LDTTLSTVCVSRTKGNANAHNFLAVFEHTDQCFTLLKLIPPTLQRFLIDSSDKPSELIVKMCLGFLAEFTQVDGSCQILVGTHAPTIIPLILAGLEALNMSIESFPFELFLGLLCTLPNILGRGQEVDNTNSQVCLSSLSCIFLDNMIGSTYIITKVFSFLDFFHPSQWSGDSTAHF
jgi:hypothetical protein